MHDVLVLTLQQGVEAVLGLQLATGQIVDRPHTASAVWRVQKRGQIVLSFGRGDLRQQLLRVLKRQRLELNLLKEPKERLAAVGVVDRGCRRGLLSFRSTALFGSIPPKIRCA
ncbi:MAG: hypothetical protein EA424_19285 [Planctomycetaceae bacterium]|nr:MAG: hypothetical protein EA424_19285 [Planctomycetaceae bacterium]